MPKQKINLKKPLYKDFLIFKKVPYRTFFGMPEEWENPPMFYSIFFNLKPLKIKKFLKLFLSSPREYQEKGIKEERTYLKNFWEMEKFYKEKWTKLNKKEKIAIGLALIHAYFSLWEEYSMFEILINCPPPEFNLETFVPKNKLGVLGQIKVRITEEYAPFEESIYSFLEELMKELKTVFLKNKEIAKKKYQKELKRIFSFKNFDEMMVRSILQLPYKYPGINRFRRPIPKIFIENVKYVVSPRKYFLFPTRKEKHPPGMLKGMGASPGKITGKACVCGCMVEEGIKKVKGGEILVCTLTTPAWLPILQKVIGAITEGGGLLSHTAIVSRELKIPCIVNVGGVTQKLKDGDLIEMDGKTGEIKILK